MAFVIILVVVGFVWGITSGLCISEKIFLSILGLILGFIIGILFWFSIGSITGFLIPKKEIVTERQIYAFNDGTSISGHRYIARGWTEEEEVIKYISDDEYGKKIFKVDADNSYINEGYDNAYVEIRDKQFKYDWFYLFFAEWYNNVYIFYVPDGSVTNEMNIDLE